MDQRLHRIDLQLLAMVDDARQRLASLGMPVREQVLMTGFSASGAFVNRFVMLHSARVLAAAEGAVNGMLMPPRPALDTDRLEFPIGVADVRAGTAPTGESTRKSRSSFRGALAARPERKS